MRALICLFLTLAAPAIAAPQDYVLEPDRSTVGFATDFGQEAITGRMPVTRADLTLDFDNVASTRIAVTLDVSRASASFPFAAQALKGDSVLDARNHPTISFISTAIRRAGENAEVRGDLTIRGVTRPVTLIATIFRPEGQAADDYSHLTVQMKGAVQRSDFGAVGFADMVADEVRLDIIARIVATP